MIDADLNNASMAASHIMGSYNNNYYYSKYYQAAVIAVQSAPQHEQFTRALLKTHIINNTMTFDNNSPLDRPRRARMR